MIGGTNFCGHARMAVNCPICNPIPNPETRTQVEGKGMNYRDEFPLHTRVEVRASKAEGSDHMFNARQGIVVEHGDWFAIKFDRGVKDWPNPQLICPHNLTRPKR